MKLSSGWHAALIFGAFSLAAQAWAVDIHVSGTRHDDYRQTPRLEFPDAAAAKAKSAADYLQAQSALFKIPADLSNLELVGVRKSLIGAHTRYRQLLNGLPVEGAEIIVSQRGSDGSVYQVYNNTYPVTTSVPPAEPGGGPAKGVGPPARPRRVDRPPESRFDLRARKKRLPPGL